jgi:hypothetical protein
LHPSKNRVRVVISVFGILDPIEPSNLASFLALSGTNFHAGLNKLGFVLQFLLFCAAPPALFTLSSLEGFTLSSAEG